MSPLAWEQIDQEARQRLVSALAARKLVEFSGPRDWDHSAANLGRTDVVADLLEPGVGARLRRVLPLVEVRADFTVDRNELRDADRGAVDLDLASLDEAVRKVALTENTAVFHGWAAAGIVGITEASPHAPITLGGNFAEYPSHVARAVATLLEAGISGPYGLALGPGDYTGVVETTEHGGLVVFDHLREILGGPIVWAPGVNGAVVISQRGGDFRFESGQDLSIGYDAHDADSVQLYVEESFTFHSVSPDAAVALTAG
jgi:uncharacterized linocin/CFP29 family protein